MIYQRAMIALASAQEICSTFAPRSSRCDVGNVLVDLGGVFVARSWRPCQGLTTETTQAPGTPVRPIELVSSVGVKAEALLKPPTGRRRPVSTDRRASI